MGIGNPMIRDPWGPGTLKGTQGTMESGNPVAGGGGNPIAILVYAQITKKTGFESW